MKKVFRLFSPFRKQDFSLLLGSPDNTRLAIFICNEKNLKERWHVRI